MINPRLQLTAAGACLMLGAAFTPAFAAESELAVKADIVLAADDNAGDDGSAEMGEGEGTQSGDEADTQENDTPKIDQPAGRNPTTSKESDESDEGDDLMPPSEDEDVPPEDGENPE
jgi:hypothetical protein